MDENTNNDATVPATDNVEETTAPATEADAPVADAPTEGSSEEATTTE